MTVILIVVLCATVYIYTVTEEQQKLPFTMNMTRLYDQGAMNAGAGIFSGLFGIPIVSILGFTGAKIVILIVLFVMLMVLTGMTLPSLVHAFTKPAVKVASNIHEAKERKAAQKEYIKAEYTAGSYTHLRTERSTRLLYITITEIMRMITIAPIMLPAIIQPIIAVTSIKY